MENLLDTRRLVQAFDNLEALCDSVKFGRWHHRYAKMYCPHLLGNEKTETAGSSETFTPIYQTTRRQIDSNTDNVSRTGLNVLK